MQPHKKINIIGEENPSKEDSYILVVLISYIIESTSNIACSHKSAFSALNVKEFRLVNRLDQSNEKLFFSLLGYVKLKYYRDKYCSLCDYLFHSVYDSKSLESFELGQYILSSSSNSGGGNCCKHNHHHHQNHLKQSTFKFNLTDIDDRLSRAYATLRLPDDWTLLGQSFYLRKGVSLSSFYIFYYKISSINQFHFCIYIYSQRSTASNSTSHLRSLQSN